MNSNSKDIFLTELLFSTSNQLAVYIHIPWCVTKCPYCDFNSHKLRNTDVFEDYLQAVINDINTSNIEQYKDISSIFFGGGTPSLFPAKYIEKILLTLQNKKRFAANIEITLEANPNSSDFKKFNDFRNAGINRISIGAQSFNDDMLKKLGRAHAAIEIPQAFEAARQANFDNINIDIMHGLPEQSLNSAILDLKRAISLAPDHISWYQLTIEPNTAFAAKPPKLPSHDLRSDIQDLGQSMLRENQFTQIEISAYAKPNKQCQHNLHIWGFNDYLGIGAGAHSKIGNIRQYRHYHPKQYIKNTDKVANISNIEPKDLLFEYMLNRARVIRPICENDIREKTKLKKQEIDLAFKQMIRNNCIKKITNGWEITTFGYNHLNTIVEELII